MKHIFIASHFTYFGLEGNMSIITVQLGQCGNQIGSSLFSVISDECLGKNKKQHGDFNSACAEIFFNTCENKDSKSDYAARSVLVDSEHKVISQVVNHVRKQCKWNYDSNSQVPIGYLRLRELIDNIVSVYLHNYIIKNIILEFRNVNVVAYRFHSNTDQETTGRTVIAVTDPGSV